MTAFKNRTTELSGDTAPRSQHSRRTRTMATVGAVMLLAGGTDVLTSACDQPNPADTCWVQNGITNAAKHITATAFITCGAEVNPRSSTLTLELQYSPLSPYGFGLASGTTEQSTGGIDKTISARAACEVGYWQGYITAEVTDDTGDTVLNGDIYTNIITINDYAKCLNPDSGDAIVPAAEATGGDHTLLSTTATAPWIGSRITLPSVATPTLTATS